MKKNNAKSQPAQAVRDVVTIDENSRLSIGCGNAKLSNCVAHYSTLPGYLPVTLKNGTQCTGVYGTCAGVCNACKNDCYAARAVKQYRETATAWTKNTLILRDDAGRLYNDMRAYLVRRPLVKYVRFHVGGEFMPGLEGVRELIALVALAREFPKVIFYGYTKRTTLLKKYLDCNAVFPQNLVISVSMWKKTTINYTGAPEFIYDAGTEEEIASLPHCPAISKDGKHIDGVKCGDNCTWCMTCKPGERMAVYAH